MIISLYWHVAETEPYQGALAEAELLKARDKRQADWAIFNPKVTTTQRWSRNRTREVTRPYLPGYIFVLFDHEDPEWPVINWTRGVKSLMYAGSETPARIPDTHLLPLLGMFKGGDLVRIDDADKELIKVGKSVKIIDGSFEGLTGTVTEVAAKRVKILMSIFGRPNEVTVKKKAVVLNS